MKAPKSSCAATIYKFMSGKWGYKLKREEPGDIYTKHDSTRIPIRRLEPHKAQEALGFVQWPDGKMDQEVAAILVKIC